MSPGEPATLRDDEREPPPILGTWRRLYALVIVELAVVVVALWLLERTFR